jgi:hypothetical protein
MGMKVAAVATMCQDRRVFDAMLAAGTPCPYEGKIGEQARMAWEENNDKIPKYEKQNKNEKDLYIMVPGPVKPKTWQTIEIEGLKASKNAKVSLLGQGIFTNEKKLQDSKRMELKNTEKGLSIDYIFLQNLYNTYLVDNTWYNPIVLKITDYKD